MTRISNPGEVRAGMSQLPANGKTIFIAEDDPFIARMYETKLGAAGFTVVLASNGRDAYEGLKAAKPDLLLLDINMPELSGFQVLAALVADGVDLAGLPIMVLTNSSNMQDMKTAQSFGAEYMIKAELTPRSVLERIQKKLGLPIADGPKAA